MNTLFEKEEREEQQDSEVTLGTGTLLAIFFGLVVVCGVFFGFGYSMGRRSSDAKAAAAQSAAAPATAEAVPPVNSRPKPSALEVVAPTEAPSDDSATRTGFEQTGEATSATRARSAAAPSRQQEPTATPRPKPAAKIISASSPAAPNRVTPSTVAQPLKPLAIQPAAAQSMVQIAAVSHPEDAEALVAALRKRGYAVSVHNEPHDNLMHVQLGPFASHAEAVTMRQKLLSDGYNAIIK